jgi:3,4-dihydroxy 2-butanone 4-phosphate synthase/GTP cyclohydrolase II
MVPENTSRYETAFTVSIEARSGVTTGISAADRARTVRVAIDPATKPEDLARPGHIFPLRARRGGVLVRTGQTEGSVDLARLAGLYPSGVICEVMNDDGTMARLPDLIAFGREHRVHICTVADLIRFRLRNERLVHQVAETPLPTRRGMARAILFGSDVSDALHLAVVVGKIDPGEVVPVRVHIASTLEDVFAAASGDNTVAMERVMDTLFREQTGVVLYLYAAGKGPEDLLNHVNLYRYQAENGCSMREAMDRLGIRRDPRDFGIGAQILASLGLHRIKLVSSSPQKLRGLEGYGLQVVDYLALDDAGGKDA